MELWARITKKTDWSTGPLARPFIRSLAPLTCSLAPHNLLCLCACCAHSLARSLTSLTPELLGKWMIRWLFILVFFYSGPQCRGNGGWLTCVKELLIRLAGPRGVKGRNKNTEQWIHGKREKWEEMDWRSHTLSRGKKYSCRSNMKYSSEQRDVIFFYQV